MNENFGVLKGLSIFDNDFNKVDILVVNENPNGLSLDSDLGSLALDRSSGKVYRKLPSDWKEIAGVDLFDFKSSVISATTSSDGNINLSSYTGGTIDGVTVVDGGRYLIKDQTNKAENGIYVYDETNSKFVRASDADSNEEVTGGLVVPVSDGSVNKNGLFILANADPIILGTTELEFVRIGLYTSGNGISISDNVINVLLANNSGLNFVSGGLSIEYDNSSIVIDNNKL